MRKLFLNSILAALLGIALVPGLALADTDDAVLLEGSETSEILADDGGSEEAASEDGDDTIEETGSDDASSTLGTPSKDLAPVHEDGWETLDGITCYWKDGAVVTGWLEIDGETFYFDPAADGAMLSDGIFEVDGAKYYFRPAGSAWGPEGSMGRGWVRGYGDPAADYFFDRTTGKLVESGWLKDFDTWFYIDPATGEYLKDGIYEIDGEKYYFRGAGSAWGPEGSVGYGWVRGLGGFDYFFDRADGRMYRDGIYEADGTSYFFRPAGSEWGPEGSVGRGWVRGWGDPAADYFFDRSTGGMHSDGFEAIDGATYLLGPDGAVARGWAEEGGERYYLDADSGKLLSGGIYEVDGESYYFRPAGSAWGPEGSMGKGWVRGYKGHDYFFDRETGAMLSDGIFEVDGAKYYFRPAGSAWGPEGSMGRGWVRGYGDPAADYFFDRTTGKLVESGWLKDFDTWFYIDPATGEYLKDGIYEIDGEKYYFRGAGSAWGPEGSMGRGWVNYDGTSYFFDRKTGKMCRNGFFIIDDVAYEADNNGKLTKQPSKYPSMLAKAQSYSSPTSYLILIDAYNNVLVVYKGSYGNWAPVKEARCSTGAAATPTPSGIFYSGAKGYSFSGDGHTCYYYTQIYGDVLMHSVLYHEGTFNYLDSRLGYHISAGCVRLAIDVAKWIYDTIPYQTKIVIYR